MKVYIVTSYCADEYEDYFGVEKVFDTKEKAEAFVKKHKGIILDRDWKNYEHGRRINEYIEEIEVE